MGIKPLYFAEAGGRFLFASEVKALLAARDLVPEVDEERLASYLLLGLHDHDERTFFGGIRQVAPATVVTVSLEPTERYRAASTATGSPGCRVASLLTPTASVGCSRRRSSDGW